MKRSTAFILILSTVISCIGCLQSKAGKQAKQSEKNYLIFCIQNVPFEDTREKAMEVRNFYGPNKASSRHMIGFSRMSILLFKHSVEQMQQIVNIVFDIAEDLEMPVYLHLDMLHNPPGHGFDGDKKFYEDPMMCEWVDFPGPEEKHGQVPRYWCNWGAWFSAPAFPCFASKKLQSHIREKLQKGVLVPLTKRLEKLKKADKEYLFAGIAVGWETTIYSLSPDDPYTDHLDPDNPPVDNFSVPPITMQKWEMAQLGYASLYHLGYDQKRLEREAKAKSISNDELFREICHKVSHDYTQMLAKECFKSGIGRDKIFSHIVATRTVDPRPSTNRPPIWTAVNPYCTPGFTLDNFGAAVYDLDVLKERILQADPSQDRFIVAETYFKKGTTEQDYTKFFNNMFDNGASLIHILAWHEGRGNTESPYYVPNDMEGPHVSVIKWLEAGK